MVGIWEGVVVWSNDTDGPFSLLRRTDFKPLFRFSQIPPPSPSHAIVE